MGKRIVKVSRDFLQAVLRGDLEAEGVTSDAPPDLEICAVMQSWEAAGSGYFEMICHSSHWDENVEGQRFPEVDIQFTKYTRAPGDPT